MSNHDHDLNVLGEPLETCCLLPLTVVMRDGECRMPEGDPGRHGVCAQVTQAFLDFTKARGNDLTTPVPQYGFPGLRPGDRRCLCASRWREALDDGVAPPVILAATHKAVTDTIPLAELHYHSL
jgi:uncharacterized protein (DUF2237 family)